MGDRLGMLLATQVNSFVGIGSVNTRSNWEGNSRPVVALATRQEHSSIST